MIRNEELLEILIADLHFHNYLEIHGSDIMNQLRNVVANNQKRQHIESYIDDVFIDFFLRTASLKPIIIPPGTQIRKYTSTGIHETCDGATLHLNNVYDRCTFVDFIFLIFFSGNSGIEILDNNHFARSLHAVELEFGPVGFCYAIRPSLMHGDDFECFLNEKYGNFHSQYTQNMRTRNLKEFHDFYLGNIYKFSYDGFTKFDLHEISLYMQDYNKIRKMRFFGDYTMEDLLFLYAIIVEKLKLDEKKISYILSKFGENGIESEVFNLFAQFEEKNRDYHMILPFLDSRDLYLRFTSNKPGRSKAFKFNPIDDVNVEIQLFNKEPLITIFHNNTLPLPYLYKKLENSNI